MVGVFAAVVGWGVGYGIAMAYVAARWGSGPGLPPRNVGIAFGGGIGGLSIVLYMLLLQRLGLLAWSL